MFRKQSALAQARNQGYATRSAAGKALQTVYNEQCSSCHTRPGGRGDFSASLTLRMQMDAHKGVCILLSSLIRLSTVTFDEVIGSGVT